MTVPRTVIETARLRLEPVSAALSGAIWEAAAASLPELRPWLGWTAAAGPESTEAFAAEAEREWGEGTAFSFAILEDQAVIGAVGLTRPGGDPRRAEIGYWIRSGRTRRGYATEAAGAAAEFAFSVLGVLRVELRAGIRNLASQRVAEKLGFSREGLLRETAWGAEAPYDCYLYGLLRTDPRPPAGTEPPGRAQTPAGSGRS